MEVLFKIEKNTEILDEIRNEKKKKRKKKKEVTEQRKQDYCIILKWYRTKLVSYWHFKPSQPQRIISGLKKLVSWYFEPSQPQKIISG